MLKDENTYNYKKNVSNTLGIHLYIAARNEIKFDVHI